MTIHTNSGLKLYMESAIAAAKIDNCFVFYANIFHCRKEFLVGFVEFFAVA